MIDYAQHLIEIERLAKQASDECLNKNYLKAKQTAILIATEARLLSLVVEEMDKRENGQRMYRYE